MAYIKIRTNDGAEFKAHSTNGIVSQMRKDQWSAPDKKADYMEEVANFVARSTGHMVRTDDSAIFLNDLEAAGLIEQTFVD